MTETARTIISVLAGTVAFVLAGVMKMRPVEGGLEIKPGRLALRRLASTMSVKTRRVTSASGRNTTGRQTRPMLSD
jgi:hypothetical protein